MSKYKILCIILAESCKKLFNSTITKETMIFDPEIMMKNIVIKL